MSVSINDSVYDDIESNGKKSNNSLESLSKSFKNNKCNVLNQYDNNKKDIDDWINQMYTKYNRFENITKKYLYSKRDKIINHQNK